MNFVKEHQSSSYLRFATLSNSIQSTIGNVGQTLSHSASSPSLTLPNGNGGVEVVRSLSSPRSSSQFEIKVPKPGSPCMSIQEGKSYEEHDHLKAIQEQQNDMFQETVPTTGVFTAPPSVPPTEATNDLLSRRRQKNMYLDLVAEQGRDLFRRSTGFGDDSSVGSTPPPPEMRHLVQTPSMIMLSEAAMVLSESPSAMMPMDVESTGGVYQLRRQRSFYYVPTDEPGSAASHGSTGSNSGAPINTGNLLMRRISRGKSFGHGKFPSHQLSGRAFGASPGASFDKTPIETRSGSLLTRNGRARSLSLTETPVASLGTSTSSSGPRVRFSEDDNGTSSKPEQSTTMLKARKSESTGSLIRRQFSEPGDVAKPKMFSGSTTLQRLANEEEQRNNKKQQPKAATRLGRRYNSRVAVFKPEDEETGAKVAQGIGQPNPERAGMVVGGGARRERAAYLLDKTVQRFSGVPETALVTSKFPVAAAPAGQEKKGFQVKRGSLQRFCESDGSAEDRPDLVRLAAPRQVHKIGILDLRIFNTDRHGGNILCKKIDDKNVNLIPIDHALSLPDWHYLAEAYFDWHYWAQASLPFDEDTKRIIDLIDVEKDGEVLRELGFPESCIATNAICTIALKVGTRHRLVLKDFGKMFQRPFVAGHSLHNKYFSPLEHMIIEACTRCDSVYNPAGSEPLEFAPVAPCSGFVDEDNLTDDGDSEVDVVNVDIDVNEKRVFGNAPPPPGFYKVFEDVVKEKCENNAWQDYLQI